MRPLKKAEKRFEVDTWGFIKKRGKVRWPATFEYKSFPCSEGIAFVRVDG